MSGEHTFGASDDIVRRIRKNLPHIEWEQPLSAERERLAADEIERLRAEVERLRAERDDLCTMVDFPEVVAGYAGPDGSTCMKVIGNDEKEHLRRSWKNAITQWQWWHQRYVAATGDTRGRTQIEVDERMKGGPP